MIEGGSMAQAARHQRIILGALVGLIVVAPHLLGGIFAWATLCLAIVATLLAGTTAWAWSDPHVGRRVEPVAIALGVVLLLTVAQAVPLPLPVAGLLAPDAVEHTTAVHGLFGMLPPRTVPLTLDPGRTHERALYAAAVWATFCTALLASTRRRSLIFAAVALSGVLVAVSDLAHLMFEATSVYGLYRPVYTPARGPILNPNNLAGMMALATPVCLGLAVRQADKRVYWGAAAVVTGASCLVANSRAGTAALAAGVVLFSAFVGLGSPRSRRARSIERWSPRKLGLAVLPLVALATSFVAVMYAAETPLDTSYANLSKLDMLREEARFLGDAGLRAFTGIGRGALPAVFSATRFPTGRVFHAENALLQYAIDFGIPAALGILGLVTVRVIRALLRWQDAAQLGALCGCIAIGLHNLIDFSLELTGIAIPVTACLAAALAEKSEQSHSPNAGALAWFSAAAGTIIVTVFGASALHHDAYVEQLDLQERIGARSGDDFWPQYRESVLSHPADPGLAMLGASRKVREMRTDAWPWIERTLHLAPSWAAPHILAAHWFLSSGQQPRAVASLRAASERDPRMAVRTLCDWLGRAPHAEVVFMVVPASGAARQAVLNGGASCLSAAPAEADKVDAVLLREEPSHFKASLRSVRRQLGRRENAAAAAAARALQRLYPGEVEPYRLQARALLAEKQADQAVQVLVLASQRVQDRLHLLLDLIEATGRAGDEQAMRSAVEQVRVASGGNTRHIAQALAALSRAESALGNQARAMRAAREAYELTADVNFLPLAARAAERLGQTAIALDTWTQACREAPSHPVFCRSRDELAKRMQGERSQLTP
jgi:hypothetical protein